MLETVSGDSNDLTLSNAQSTSNTDHHLTLPRTEQSSEQPKLSVIVKRTDDLAPDSQTHQHPESKLKLAEEDSGIDEEVLQLESKKMVDRILTNALAALQKMEASETEHDMLLTYELEGQQHEGSEAVLFEGLDGRRDGGTGAKHLFHVMLSDQTLSVVLEEDLAGSCSHTDCSRSQPSSGYESITGSDTDIRCFVGFNSEVTTTSVPVSSQNENQTVLEYFVVDIIGSRKSCGRKSAAEDEPLSLNLHSHRDVVHKTDIKLFLPALSEESLSQEQHICDDTGCKEKRGNGSQETAKYNAMSNNCKPRLNSSCESSIITPASAIHQESLQQSQILSDPFSHSLVSDMADSDMMPEITQQPPALPSHEPEEPEALYSGSSEQEQISGDSIAGTDSSAQSSVTVVQCSGGRHHPSHWVSVQAFRCNVTDDQSLSPTTPKVHWKSALSVNLENAGTSAVSVSGRRLHLDPTDSSSRTAAAVPHHSRFHDLDLHQVGGAFAIISEEEDSDMVFINDTGPMHSPSTRLAKAYPLSLSPIYEEEFGCEEPLGQETLQFPPATEEEQRSVEQPAMSILSLLQSVSEKLQSSVISGDDSSTSVASPLSYRNSHGDDSEEDDEDSSNLLNHQLTGANPEPNPEHEHSSNIDGTANDAPYEMQEEQSCDGTLGNIGKNANTPFYQYLQTGLIPSGDEEPEDTKRVCHSGCNAVEENRGFGKVNPRPTPMLIYEGHSLSGERTDICADVEDVLFADGTTLHALRGCWLLYVDSWYRGSCVLLEEGLTVKTRAHQKLEDSRTDLSAVLSVGSVRKLLKDDSAPEIHLYPSTYQTGETVRLYSATDLVERHMLLSDLYVKTGCWLVFEQPGFSGMSAILETDRRVTPVLQDSLVSCVNSLRPLKMGGLWVTRPLDPKIMLFEKLQFQGQCRELLDHMPHLTDIEPVSSLRVTGGMCVSFVSREMYDAVNVSFRNIC